MQITLPDDRKLKLLASEAGFTSVDEYVLQLIEREASEFEASREESDAAWIDDFRDFLRTLKSNNPHFDDSRESIYPPR